jgi:tetratricopeptide (TPR) repeat protein
LAVAALLLFQNATGGRPPGTAPLRVEADHAARLAANIEFFETRLRESGDSLSYNRLTALYLQRFREAGDPADIRRAESSATRSLEAAPGDYAGLINLALVRIVQHEFTAAAALAERARIQIPLRPDAYAVLGDAQLALGQYDQATTSYRTYLDSAPGFAAFSRQASLAEIHGNLPLATQFWQAAIQAAARSSAPEDAAWAHVQLGNLFFATTTGNAGREFQQALDIYPKYAGAQAGLARVAAAHGDFTRAIALYSEVNARAPALENVIALGEVYTRAGRPQDAAKQYALAGAITGLLEANGVRSDLTAILFALDHGGDVAEALGRARAAYEERPSLTAADVYAWALYRAGEFSEARVRIEEALRTGAQDPLFLFHAGMIAVSLGDLPAATARLERALKLNPGFSLLHAPEAARTLKSLKGK